ncbi:MAG: alanine racemase [Lachnospirales bacterium]
MINNSFATINLNNILHNYNTIKKYVNKNNTEEEVLVMGVIKANAYGHGAINIARFLKENGCDYLGVSSFLEASNLRRNYIKTPTLVLSEVDLGYIDYVCNENITISVFSYKYAKKVSDICGLLDKECKIHIKVDTGMLRVGVSYSEAVEEIKNIVKLPNIYIEGIYSHFATADEKDDNFMMKQYNRFIEVLDALENLEISFKYKHIANSAGVFNWDKVGNKTNLVRVGIAMYGHYPSEEVDKSVLELKSALSLKTKVLKLNDLEEGEGLSYGLTYKAIEHRKVATVGVGYGDGFPRNLSNKGYVEVNNQKAKIIGSVCMDKMMIDITDIDNVKINDEVVIFGNLISVEEVAKLINTINYEILTRIQNRVTRIYEFNGDSFVESDNNFVF